MSPVLEGPLSPPPRFTLIHSCATPAWPPLCTQHSSASVEAKIGFVLSQNKSGSYLNLFPSSFPTPEVSVALGTSRKGSSLCSCRQTRSQNTRQCFPLSQPHSSGADRKRACISRHPASGLKGEGIRKTSTHSSKLGTRDHFHSLGNSVISTPTNWPWQNTESLHVRATIVLWVIQYSELMLHSVGGIKHLVKWIRY